MAFHSLSLIVVSSRYAQASLLDHNELWEIITFIDDDVPWQEQTSVDAAYEIRFEFTTCFKRWISEHVVEVADKGLE